MRLHNDTVHLLLLINDCSSDGTDDAYFGGIVGQWLTSTLRIYAILFMICEYHLQICIHLLKIFFSQMHLQPTVLGVQLY